MNVFEVGCYAVATVMVGLRLTRWRTTPQSRPFTVALTLLMSGVALRHPKLLNSTWLDSNTAAGIHLANFTDLVGDLLIVMAAGYIGVLVARAWRLDHVGPWITRGAAAAALLMVILWSISDAPTTPATYVGQLGGPATAYSCVAAGAILLAHLSILMTILIVRVPAKMRLALSALGLAALLGVVKNVLRIASHIDPDAVTPLRDRLDWPMSLSMILLYAISGLIGYLMAAPKRAGRTGPDLSGRGSAPVAS